MKSFVRFFTLFVILCGATHASHAQQTAVTSTSNGNKVYLEMDLTALRANLDSLFAASSSGQAALGNLTWSEVLGNGTTPGMDVNFFGYDLSGLGDLTASGTLTSDSLVLNKDASIIGRLTIGGVGEFSDSLTVGGMVEFADSLRVVKSVSIGEQLFVTGVTQLGDSLHVVGNVDLNALFNVDGAATFGSSLSVAGVASFADSLSVAGVSVLGDSLNVGGNAHLMQNLQVDGDVNFGGGLVVAGETSFADTVNFAAPALFADSASFAGNVNMAGDLSVSSLSINGVTIPAMDDTDDLPEGASNLYFTDSRAQGAFTEGTGVSLTGGVIAIGQAVATTDDVAFDELSVDSIAASGMLSLSGLALFGDSINVSGNAHLKQDLQVDGDVNFGGGLVVAGETSFADTVNFAAPALFADSVSFAGNVNMAGNLSVSSLSINGVTIPAMDNTDDLQEGASNLYFTDSRAQGAFTEGTGVSLTEGVIAIGQAVGTADDVAFDELSVDSVIASGMLSVNGLALFGDSLNVSGNTHLQQDLQVDGDVNFGGSLSVNGEASFADTVNFAAPALFADSASFAGNVNMAGDLFVSSLSINGVTIPAMDDTDDLPEGASNLYFTDSRAQGAFTEGTGVSLTGGVIAIGQAVGTTDDVAFDELSVDSIAASGSLTIAGRGMFNDSLHVTGGATFQASLEADSLVTGGLSVAGGVRIQDGNQATGKVLVSDSVGNATWQTAPSAYTAGTGVSITDQVISIGQAVADSSDVAFAKVVSDSLVTSALRIQDGNEGAGRLLMSDAEGNASWGTISGSGDLVFTESIQMRGHNTAITKPTMLIDEISLTDDGTGWCTVDMQYAFLDISGAAGGIAESRVFQLPAGYEFDLDYHEVSLGANMLQPENGWGYGGIRGILPDASGWVNNNIGDWDRLTVVPYSATEFRVGLVPSGMHSWAWLGQGWYILTDPHYVLLNFRFKKDPPAILATTSTASAEDLGPESATLNGAVVFDGNDVVTATGFVWGEQADLSDGTSAAGSATSGSFTADLTGLTAGTTYYFTAFVTNAVGTSYGDTLNFTAPYFACSNSSVTYDGVAYHTVSIGDQCWFATNLQTDQYRDGSPIAGSLSNAEWISTSTGAQAAYNNDENNVASFGRLYNWYAASDPRGLCPTGWRVPTSDDFTALVTELGGNAIAGQQLKSSASDSPAWNGTNASGFNGLGGGLRENSSGLYLQVNERGLYWSSTSTTAPGGWSLRLLSNSNASEISDSYSTFGYRDGMSVRCISDDGTSTAASLPIALTEAESDLAAASVTLNGQVFSDGGAPVAATGFVWGQQADLSDGTTISGSNTTGAFTAALSSLSSGTTYYYSAFATNSTGTDYGDTLSFTTLSAPTVSSTLTSSLYSACTNVASSIVSDGNSSVTASGFVVGAQANLSDGTSVTGDLDGSDFTGQLSGLTPGTTYYVSAFATNAAGTGYGDTLSFSTPTFVCGSDELTYDGYAYSTVQIGSQCWFDENLRATTYSNGDPIPSGLTNSEWISTAEGAMTVYGEGGASENTNLATYGRLYNGFAAQDSRNLCPCGWHVPTDAEFVALENEVGGLSVAGTALKAASPAWNGNDDVQFNALPGGGRNWNSGEFLLQGTSGYWWATDATPTSGWTHQMLTESGGVNRYFVTNIRDGLSIRCVADAGTAYVPQFENLLINGGAESDLDGWTVTAGAVESNTAGQCGSTTQRSGLRFFTVGGACAKTGLARMHQDVSVTAYATDIDAGTYEVRATAWMRNWSAGNDMPEFRVVFLDESSVEISSTPYTSGALSSWSEFTIEVAIPQGTRAIRLELQGTRLSGGDNDSYFDDMTLGVGFTD